MRRVREHVKDCEVCHLMGSQFAEIPGESRGVARDVQDVVKPLDRRKRLTIEPSTGRVQQHSLGATPCFATDVGAHGTNDTGVCDSIRTQVLLGDGCERAVELNGNDLVEARRQCDCVRPAAAVQLQEPHCQAVAIPSADFLPTLAEPTEAFNLAVRVGIRELAFRLHVAQHAPVIEAQLLGDVVSVNACLPPLPSPHDVNASRRLTDCVRECVLEQPRCYVPAP
mmetsp:Transcript_67638/g.188734  ORF Transcript_67638/g.188734 Transcript_67638/m.188734 type:complete len:225 (+) Transcript_67638:80-754(+)